MAEEQDLACPMILARALHLVMARAISGECSLCKQSGAGTKFKLVVPERDPG